MVEKKKPRRRPGEKETQANVFVSVQSFILESYQSFYDTILYEYDPALTLKASQQPSGHRKIQHAGIEVLEPMDMVVNWVGDLVRMELQKNNPDFVMDS